MKIIGKTTELERDKIKEFFFRKNALIELIKSLKPEDTIYEKAVRELSETNERFQECWNEIGKRFNLSCNKLSIDFKTCEVSIVE